MTLEKCGIFVFRFYDFLYTFDGNVNQQLDRSNPLITRRIEILERCLSG